MNTSGFKPYDIGILVKIKEPEEKQTKGGIILSSKAEAVSIEASQTGTIVDMGALAFIGDDGHPYKDSPKVGDQVFFKKYSGQFIYSHQSDDEQNYRAMDCHDVRLIKEQ